jgi:cell wall-associated NlpC family hydrolase
VGAAIGGEAIFMRRSLTLTGLLFLFVLLGSLAQAGKARAAVASKRAARVVRVALGQRGVPYRWAGTSPRTGFDCSGFTRWVYSHVGITLPHSSYAQYGMGRHVALRALRPGDLLFFYGLGHVGIYIGHGRFIDAPQTGDVVRVRPLVRALGALDGARRLL